MAKKKKYFVVWVGENPGIYDTWEECQQQVVGYPNARYKSFKTKEKAVEAFQESHEKYWGKNVAEPTLSKKELEKIGLPNTRSIAVDGAWSSKTGKVEYQGVFTDTKTELFHVGPLEDGTNNIAEFLALVHALAYCQKHKLDYPIYSDSRTAISWVRKKKANTKHPQTSKNKKLFHLIHRAIKWLHENEYSNEILKWETKAWGENPADFGRK